MGYSRYSDVDWDRHAKATSGKSREEIFTRNRMSPGLDPAKFKFREAVDSEANPLTTPIILGSDITGSMGILAETVTKVGFGKIMKELYARKPVTDPQILCMAIGDATCDQAPVQATQFESAVEPIVQELADIYLEAGGGSNPGESYALAWAFAAYKTKCDAIRKRHRKGYLFTIGDECALPTVKRQELERFLGLNAPLDLSTPVLLEDVQKDWNIFHLIIKPVSSQPVEASWKALLGQRAVLAPDVETMAEGIVSIIQMCEGAALEDVVSSWKGDRALPAVKTITSQLVSPA